MAKKAKKESVLEREARLKAEAEAAERAAREAEEARLKAEAEAERKRLAAKKPKRPRFVRPEREARPEVVAPALPEPSTKATAKLLSKVVKPLPTTEPGVRAARGTKPQLDGR